MWFSSRSCLGSAGLVDWCNGLQTPWCAVNISLAEISGRQPLMDASPRRNAVSHQTARSTSFGLGVVFVLYSLSLLLGGALVGALMMRG